MDGQTIPGIKGAVTSTISLNIIHPLDSGDDEYQEVRKIPQNYEIPAGATQKPLNLNIFPQRDGNVRIGTRRDNMACTNELAEAFIDSFEAVARQLLMANENMTVDQVFVLDITGIKRNYLASVKAPQSDVSTEKDHRIDLSGLKDKSVLTRGGAFGPGLASTRVFAVAGAHVTIADVRLLEMSVKSSLRNSRVLVITSHVSTATLQTSPAKSTPSSMPFISPQADP